MPAIARTPIALAISLVSLCATFGIQSSLGVSSGPFHPAVARIWDNRAMAVLELPLAGPIGSAIHPPADYYYKIPIRAIYKSYPIYEPGHEPSGYLDSLKIQQPVIMWDATHRPPLQTRQDWIRAGEMVFDSSTFFYNLDATLDQVRSPEWYRTVGVPVTGRGVMPFERYVIRKKGTIEVSGNSCATCHTRVMPDGSLLKGAQGNFPIDRDVAFRYRASVVHGDPAKALREARNNELYLYAAPWVQPDPLADLKTLTVEQIASRHDRIPPGVIARHGTNVIYPVQVPDLIGVQGRRYLDRTGLQLHRGIVDLMRYAALNQGGDALSSFAGFIPADYGSFKRLPDPADFDTGERYSDEQLYALALYLYSLVPPKSERV